MLEDEEEPECEVATVEVIDEIPPLPKALEEVEEDVVVEGTTEEGADEEEEEVEDPVDEEADLLSPFFLGFLFRV